MSDTNEIKTEVIHKEIDLIQSCISRMASNSFLLKGWVISLVAVILAMIPKNSNVILISSLILEVIIFYFWYLDAFFLRLEKMYRELYKWVLVERPKGNYENLYDLNPHRFDCGRIRSVMFSPTLKFFYGIPMFLIIIIIIYNSYIIFIK